jgi:hypothetical protein
MASFVYNSYKAKLFSLANSVNLATDTIKVMLTTSAYVPDQDNHAFINQVTSEVVGAGYVAGGSALANKTVTQDNTNDKGVFDADDVTWANSTITARYAVVYKDTGTPATAPLICVFDFGSDKISTGGPFTITWAAAGILTVA